MTALEGLRDDVMIDMVMRRIEDMQIGSSPGAPADLAAFEASLSILMGDRAHDFTGALWSFLGQPSDSATVSDIPIASNSSKAGGVAPATHRVNGIANGPAGGSSDQSAANPQYTVEGSEGSGEEDEYAEEGEEYDDEDDRRASRAALVLFLLLPTCCLCSASDHLGIPRT